MAAYADFVITQGTTSPLFTWQLIDSNFAVIDLTNATGVTFVMRKVSSSTPAVTAAATITNAEAGEVSYQWAAADTASAGIYSAQFVITYSSGLTQASPGDGYLEIMVEENLSTVGGQTIVSLGEVKEYLNIGAADKSRDSKLLRAIRATVPVIENICGSVLQTQWNEWYTGGQAFIALRHRPVLELIAVSEYRGPIEYVQQLIGSPDEGQIYSAMIDLSTVVRRSAGGGIIAFPQMPQSVHVVYVAGLASIPDNIREGNLELLRVNYQHTQQQGRPGFGGGSSADDDMLVGQNILGFFVPNRVREMLSSNKRHPSIA